jgi:hypothetical protein
MKLTPLKIKGLFSAFMSLAAVCYFAFGSADYKRVTSPDGKYIAVAEYSIISALDSMPIGSSGDKKGSITIKTKDGRKIGKRKVEMVSFINDIRWSSDEASIPSVATWSLKE